MRESTHDNIQHEFTSKARPNDSNYFNATYRNIVNGLNSGVSVVRIVLSPR